MGNIVGFFQRSYSIYPRMAVYIYSIGRKIGQVRVDEIKLDLD